MPLDLTRTLARRALDGDLPDPVYAAVGLADEVTQRARDVVTAAARTPGEWLGAVTDQYGHWVSRGQTRSVEIATERAVRGHVSRFEDRVAPSAARATARWNERRKRARSAARRLNEWNRPVLAESPGQSAPAARHSYST